MTTAQHARIPAPAVARVPEPAPVVIRRPAPRIVTDPSPAIPVFPRPTAATVRRPIYADRHGRTPDMPVRRNVRPGSVVVELLRPINAFRNVLIAGRLRHRPVAVLVPVVPLI